MNQVGNLLELLTLAKDEKDNKAIMDQYWACKVIIDQGNGVVRFDDEWVYTKTPPGIELKHPRVVADQTIRINLLKLTKSS